MALVRLFGPVEVVAGGSIVRVAPFERTLIAALASRSGERVGVEVLEDALWPTQPPTSARKTLQGHVMRLRRVLGPSAIRLSSGGYLLDPDHVQVDAADIPRLLAEAREAIRRGDPGDAVEPLRVARVAFRGDPYADVPEAALPAGEVHRMRELGSAVIEEAFEAELARGRGAECVGDLEAFVERNPYRERAWGQLMRALYQAGRPADALAAYGRARVVLAAELGIEPGPALRDVERSILDHDAVLLSTTVRGGLGAANLPAGLNPIIGRARELAMVDRLLGDNRLVTLTGTGGIGKTRLAVELAAGTAGRFEHGPYFADLSPIGAVEHVPAALAAALGIVVDAHSDTLDCVRSAAGDGAFLVVLDNCEHLLSGVAEVVARLLASAPGVRVLATSRAPLEVPGEVVWPLEPLVVPSPSCSVEQIRQSEAGALFFARSPTNVAARALSPDDVAAVGTVCRILEGIPLGLELAAARTRTLSLPQLADRLGRSIGELGRGGQGVLPRHRTMRAALDWGVELLSPPAQTALRAMSVFAGGCDLAAFAAICVEPDAPPPVEVLDELVRTSFATVDFTREPARYRLLEPVRQYASDLLDASGEGESRQQRHLRFYADVVQLRDHENQENSSRVDELLDQLQLELGNLRTALDTAIAASDRVDAGLELASSMYQLWVAAPHHREGVGRIVGLLGTGNGSAQARARAAYIAAIVAARMGDSDHSLALCEQALHEAGGGASSVEERRARQVLSQILLNRGDVAAARQQLAPALPTPPDPASDVDAFCLVSLAELELVAGNLDEAEAAARHVLSGTFGSCSWIGTSARHCLGEIMLERGELDLCRSWLNDAITLGEQLGDVTAVIDTHLALVVLDTAVGRLGDADTHFRAATAAQTTADRENQYAQLGFLQAQAILALHHCTPAHAVALSEQALTLANAMASARHRCVSLRLLGDAQLAAGDIDSALSTFERLVVTAGAPPYPSRLAEAHEGAAAAAITLGQHRMAVQHLTAATEIRVRTGTQRVRRPVVEEHLVTLEAGYHVDV